MGRAGPAVRVLMLGGAERDVERVRDALAGSTAMCFELSHCQRPGRLADRPDSKEPDVVLVELGADRDAAVQLLTQARESTPLVPVVAMSSIDDEAFAVQLLRAGARGFLVSGEIETRPLVTTLGAVLESHRAILQLNTARQRARHLATHDQLTNLPNRICFGDRLDQAVEDARRESRRLAVLLLDLDGFKSVNDALGTAVGDGVLRGIARRIRSCLRPDDTAARLGGDEFGVILAGIEDEEDARAIARRLLETLARPIPFSRQSTVTTASIGIAIFPKHGHESEILVRKADTAMHHAKRQGRDRAEVYERDMSAAVVRPATRERRLRSAIERDELRLYFQPQFDLRRARIVGSEALLRWQHPEEGLLSPAGFLGLAEESGLIVPIGAWALRTACLQTADWQRRGHRGLRVSVNVASQQFLEPDFAEVVAAVLEESGLPPVSLELEITETSLLQDVDVTVNTLRALKRLGVRLAIDDFGTGYSAMAYLRRLPIDVLKIDQSFVRGLTTDPADATITASIVSMARGLDLGTVAEGVESLEQLLLLGSYGCQRMQGFLFGQPVPAEKFGEWLENPPFRWMRDVPAAGIDSADPT
jgi:diguanylate cyclase (GGDEF)-like protein